MAACTSRAAPFTSRVRSNCIVIDVDPIEELDVIWLTPAMRLNCRSSGVAIAEAIVSGSAPGSDAPTLMVGNSTCGRLDTGNSLYATAPARMIATDSRKVATGRRMNGAEKCTRPARAERRLPLQSLRRARADRPYARRPRGPGRRRGPARGRRACRHRRRVRRPWELHRRVVHTLIPRALVEFSNLANHRA